MGYRAVVFDLDGLLIDSERIYRSINYRMAADFGKTLPEDIWEKQMGRTPLESLKIFRKELGISSHSAGELVDLRNGMLLEAYKADLQVLPGAAEIVGAFYGRLMLAIATGSPRMLMEMALPKIAAANCFDFILPSDEIQAGKPDPEIYLRTAAALGVCPDECIVLEDSSNGVVSAHRAGCFVIAVPSEYTKGQDFSHADRFAADLFEAREIIEGLCADC